MTTEPTAPKTRIPPERLAEVERRILLIEAPADFVPELAREWRRSKRQVWTYVAIVRARLAARVKAADPDADRELTRSMLLEAFRAARIGHPEKGADAKGMVAAARTFGELTGAMGPRKVEITGRDGGPIATVATVVMMPALDDEPPAADSPVAPEPGATD